MLFRQRRSVQKSRLGARGRRRSAQGVAKMLINGSLVSRRAVAKLGVLLCALAANAMAESPPGSIPVGPMFAYPELEVAVKRDTNIALQPDALRQADTIWYLRPTMRLEAKDGVNLYDVTY